MSGKNLKALSYSISLAPRCEKISLKESTAKKKNHSFIYITNIISNTTPENNDSQAKKLKIIQWGSECWTSLIFKYYVASSPVVEFSGSQMASEYLTISNTKGI